MHKCRTSLELFFAIWFVMGNVWVFDSRFSSFHRAPKLHVLCISLLAWNAICYSFPFLLFLLLCCCVPLISSSLGYNMNMGSVDRGASDDQISQLPSWKYKAVDTKLEHGNDTDCNSGPHNEDPVSDTTPFFRIATYTRLAYHTYNIKNSPNLNLTTYYLACIIGYSTIFSCCGS